MSSILGYPENSDVSADEYVATERVISGRVHRSRSKPGALKVSDGSNTNTLTTWTAQLTTESGKLSGVTGHAVQSAEVTFTETAGAGTYTGTVALPAGATILDIIVNGVALWTNTGTATMKVGDTDDDGFFTGIDLKATDLLAGESLSFALAGGKAGAYIANSQVSPRYSASARNISGIISTSSTGGGAGRTRMTVIWSAPAAAYITAATKA